jgi:protein-S-isoprenylcysteine O-methyltransferase Ste14
MSQKTNALLFILAATVVNILLTVVSFLALYLPYALLIAPRLPPSSVIWTLALLFLLALVISFIAYHALLKLFIKKVDVRKRFGSLIKGSTSRD